MTTIELHQRIAELEALLEEKDAKIAYLEEQFRLAQHKQFGQSSEGHPGQGELFNEAEALIDTPVELENISYTRNKPTRKPLPKDLPREVVGMTLLMKRKSVIAAGRIYTKSVKIKARSSSLSQLRSKLLNMFVLNTVAEHVKKTERVIQLNKRPSPTVLYLKGMPHQAC